MTTAESNAAREAAAAICAAELTGKGYTPAQLATIAFLEGVVHGMKEMQAISSGAVTKGGAST